VPSWQECSILPGKESSTKYENRTRMALTLIRGRGRVVFVAMLKELDGYDWAEVFGEGSGGNCSPIIPDVPPGDEKTSRATFSREDVLKIHGQCEGENDEQSWIIWGRLKDGRWFKARGSCDHTGWDCQASNDGDAASSKADLIRFGMDDSERERFGLKI